jgi:tripartite-type tricarboxylate transporter receptor subunit TctC
MIPGYDLAVIQGLFARTGTPQPIVQKVAAEMAAIVRDPEVIQQFGVAGIEPVGAGPDEFRTALANEAERIAKVVQIVGLKAQ